jgi:ABC-type branched-subunit amino acid transport system substrate-binding protein
VFVNPGWTSQLSAIGEWAGIVHKPIISGGATSPIFAQENFGYVSRSVPSSLYSIEAYVELIKEYGFSLINLVHMNDEWGSSVARELVSHAGDGFQIQVLRSFESADDVDGIQSALDDIQASPTRVTFVCTTEIHTGVFLNAAGKRGMHETQLWLAPKAAGNSIVFDPPSSGGIWAITDGEEMTEDNPLGQRYLAKDLTPHIEAQEKYGFNNVTDELTYWGAYYYDAVLAAAHALAAAKNRSDGEEVLKEIHNLSLDNANTGVLEMDENGERRGARNPVFYITPEGEKVQFALYDGNLDILQDPLWPGGSTIQPKLIMENTSAKR